MGFSFQHATAPTSTRRETVVRETGSVNAGSNFKDHIVTLVHRATTTIPGANRATVFRTEPRVNFVKSEGDSVLACPITKD